MEIGNVEAVLSARDSMSPTLVAAAQKVADLREQLKSLGMIGGAAYESLNMQLKAAEASFNTMRNGLEALGGSSKAVTEQYNELAKSTGATAAAHDVARKRLDDVDDSTKKVNKSTGDLDSTTKGYGQSMSQVEGIATRLIERLIILAAIKGSYELVKGLFDQADALVRVNQQTDISLTKLQQLSYAADVVGIPFDKATGAIDHLDKTLGAAKMSTSDALGEIGLSFDKVFKLSPDERFDTITAAIAKIPDAARRAKIETELLGTDGLDPMIQRLKDLEAAAPTLEDGTIRGLHNTVQAYRSLWAEVEPILDRWIEKGQKAVASIANPTNSTTTNVTTGLGMTAGTLAGLYAGTAASGFFPPAAPFLIGGGALLGMGLGAYGGYKDGQFLSGTQPGDIDLPQDMSSPHLWTGVNQPGGSGGSGGPSTGQKFIDELKARSQETIALTANQKTWLSQLVQMNELTADNAARLGLNSVQFKEYEKQVAAAAKALAAFNALQKRKDAAYASVESSGGSVEETLKNVPGDVVEAGMFALRGGATPEQLRLVWDGLTEAESEAIKKKQVMEDEAQKKWEQDTQRGQDNAARLWDEYYSGVAREDSGSTAQKLANVEKWYNEQVARSRTMGAYQADFLNAAEAAAETKRQAILDYDEAQTHKSLDRLQVEYDTYYEAVSADSGTAADKQIAAVQKWFDQQVKILNNDKAAKDNEDLWRQHYDILTQIAQQKIQDILHAHDPLWIAFKNGNEDMRKEWAATFEKGLTDADKFVDALASPLNDLNTMWKKMLAGMLADWEYQLLAPIMSDAREALGAIFGMGSGGAGGATMSGGSRGSQSIYGLASMFGGAAQYAGTSSGNWGYIYPSEQNPGFADQLPSTAYTGINWGMPGGTGISGGAKMSSGARYGGGALMAAAGAYQMYQNQGLASNVMGGVETGAGIGTMIAPGIGTAIGAGIGAIAGVVETIALKDHTKDDIVRDAANHYGEVWNSELVDTIKKNKERLGDEVAGELASLPEIIKENPVTDNNVGMYTDKVHDLFTMLGTGHMQVAEVSKELDAIFPDLAAHATDAYGFISDGLQQIIDLNGEWGTDSKAITAFINAQAGSAHSGFMSIGMAMTFDQSGQVLQMKSQLEDVNAQIADLEDKKKKSGLTNVQTEKLSDLYDTQKSLNGSIALGSVGPTAQDLADLGQGAFGDVALGMSTGKSKNQAIKDESQLLTQLEKEYKALGINVEDAGLKQLFMMNDLQKMAPNLITGVEGVREQMVSMVNLRIENADSLAAQERLGYDMYTRIQGQVAQLGGSTADALEPMQDYLHSAQTAAEKLGVPLDENIQMMIDQSKQLGIWKSNADPAQTSTDLLAKAVEDLVNWLNRIPQNKTTTVTTKYEHEGDTPPDNAKGPPGKYGWNDDGSPDWDNDPSTPMAGGGLASGRTVRFKSIGTDVVPTMLTPNEGIVTVAGMSRLGRSGLEAINSGGMFGGDNGAVVGMLQRLLFHMQTQQPKDIARAVKRAKAV